MLLLVFGFTLLVKGVELLCYFVIWRILYICFFSAVDNVQLNIVKSRKNEGGA